MEVCHLMYLLLQVMFVLVLMALLLIQYESSFLPRPLELLVYLHLELMGRLVLLDNLE